ncbi:MAG: Hsp20/alpha crystallin family protein [Myxococcota bacterium]|nr:Hsp20/alpha crystallin family protein [Myxococcota bacterium]
MTKKECEMSISPRVDIFENDTTYKMITDLPGVSVSELDIRYERNYLELKADTLNRSFYRRFHIPNVSDQEISAELKNGILEIALPKAATVKARVVPVTVG